MKMEQFINDLEKRTDDDVMLDARNDANGYSKCHADLEQF